MSFAHTPGHGIIGLATQPNAGRFVVYESADATTIENYWAVRPVSEDLRPAGCVAASATDTGRFAFRGGNNAEKA